MARRLKIALLIDSSCGYGQNLQRGIAAYARRHGPWSFYHQQRMPGDRTLVRLKDWGCDGIIGRIERRQFLRQIKQARLPMVDLFGQHELEEIPTLDNDFRAITRLAAEHLLERGFEHFAFCGFAGLRHSEKYREGFVEYLARAGCRASVYVSRDLPGTAARTGAGGRVREKLLAAWIKALPKPVGLMACNDLCAQHVLNACAEHEIAVPDDVAVIGVDNDELLCELSDPPLSSIDPNAQKIGYEGAALLDRMIHGQCPPAKTTRIEPLGVLTRQSTDVLAVPDRTVAAAVHFIRQHACEGITVEDVLRQMRLSLSTLERRFVRSLGRLPKAEIIHVQLQRVKQLLAETDYPLPRIAQLAGFQHVENMIKLFKSKTGRTPGQYRRTSQV